MSFYIVPQQGGSCLICGKELNDSQEDLIGHRAENVQNTWHAIHRQCFMSKLQQNQRSLKCPFSGCTFEGTRFAGHCLQTIVQSNLGDRRSRSTPVASSKETHRRHDSTLRQADLAVAQQSHSTPLMSPNILFGNQLVLAASEGDLSTIDCLLKQKELISSRHLGSAVISAADQKVNSFEIVNLLLNYKNIADNDEISDYDLNCAAMHALNHKNIHVFERLITTDQPLNAIPFYPVVEEIIHQEKPDFLRLIWPRFSYDQTLQDRMIKIAIEKKHFNLVPIMLPRGAKISADNICKIFLKAAQLGSQETLDLLRQRQPISSEIYSAAINVAAYYKQPEIAQWLRDTL
jgi:hypothetical protein